jgi:hypothetical protein
MVSLLTKKKRRKEPREKIVITRDNRIEIYKDRKKVKIPSKTHEKQWNFFYIGIFCLVGGLAGLVYATLTWNEPSCGTLWALGIGIGLMVISLRFLLSARKK